MNKRKTYFLEHLNSKRKNSRIDIYMKWLKDFCGTQIFDIEDKDVLDFLIFKEINNSGRTIVHHNACPNLGLKSLDSCTARVKCSFRHAAHSMRIGIVLKLRKAFQEVGRRGQYEPLTARDGTRGVWGPPLQCP